MSLVEWDGKYLLGLPEIDEHHQHLFTLIQRAFDCYNRGESDQSIRTLLDELMEYAAYHFASEEMLMGEIGYPGIAEHNAEHGIFTEKAKEMLDLYQTIGSAVLSGLLIFLNAWLTQHILQKDADYARYRRDTPPSRSKVATA